MVNVGSFNLLSTFNDNNGEVQWYVLQLQELLVVWAET
ncbi:hypothetical protein VINE108274_00995 [Vibrio neptunius]